MTRWLLRIGMLFALLASTGVIGATPQSGRILPADRVAGEFLIKYTAGASAEQRAAAARAIGGTIVDTIADLRIDVVRIDPGGQVGGATDAVSALEQQPAVEYAQPNYVYTAQDTGPFNVHLPLVSSIREFIPSDPHLIDQDDAWRQIAAYQGWLYTRGSSNVVIAVIDSGVQLSHPEFAGKLVRGIDYIDGDSTPDDLNGHGTHVAGIAAARINNGAGGAGACPECRIMPIRVLNANGSGSSSNVIRGIQYAVDHGAQVINMSLGGNQSDYALEEVVSYAAAKGVFLACAAGNYGSIDPMFPAYYSSCFAVGAVGADDQHASYSNYGSWVDLAAPGTSIYSTVIDGYGYKSGTSMATPYVAGVAGLLASQGLSAAQIQQRLAQTADVTSGTGTWWSNGRLNMQRALRGY